MYRYRLVIALYVKYVGVEANYYFLREIGRSRVNYLCVRYVVFK